MKRREQKDNLISLLLLCCPFTCQGERKKTPIYSSTVTDGGVILCWVGSCVYLRMVVSSTWLCWAVGCVYLWMVRSSSRLCWVVGCVYCISGWWGHPPGSAGFCISQDGEVILLALLGGGLCISQDGLVILLALMGSRLCTSQD